MQWGLWPSHNGKIRHRVPSVLQCWFQWMRGYGRFWQQVLDKHRADPLWCIFVNQPLGVRERDRCVLLQHCNTVRFKTVFISVLTSPAAMSHLNGQKVFGKVMRVTLSKHQTVALPREGLDDQLLTKGNWPPAVHHLYCWSRSLFLGMKSPPTFIPWNNDDVYLSTVYSAFSNVKKKIINQDTGPLIKEIEAF